MRWDLLPNLSAFERARRRDVYRKLTRVVRGQERPSLLDLDEVRSRLGVVAESYVGIRPIPVARVVGTAGRSRDFDRDFVPVDERVRERWRRVEQAFPLGDYPPIEVYEVDGSYFVVDGHHRVAVARERGVEYIDAEVTRLITRAGLPEGADVGRLILIEQERLFMEGSGLGRARPGARIEFSRPPGYPELLDVIIVYAYDLSMERGHLVPIGEAAGDWYDRVYLPTVEAIHREGLVELFPDSTEADLFLWVSQRRRLVAAEQGGMSLEEAVRRERTERRKR